MSLLLVLLILALLLGGFGFVAHFLWIAAVVVAVVLVVALLTGSRF